MLTLEEAVSIAVAATLRADSTIQSSLVDAGILVHPLTTEKVLAFATYGRVKIANLRVRPQIAVTFRTGGTWATMEGTAELAGADSPQGWLDPEGLRRLFRDVFTAAGGAHDDWDEYDRVMAEQRRTVVLVRPTRIYSN